MIDDGTTNSQGISSGEWDLQQDQIDQWVVELAERLKVDKARVKLALFDWVYINTETDWLEVAAKQDSFDHQGWPRPSEGYGAELREFIAAATLAWQKAWGEGGEQPNPRTAEDVLNVIRDLIDDFDEIH